MFFRVKFSPPTDHPPLQRLSHFEWWLCGWRSFGVFIVMVKSDGNRLGLNITCICQLVSSVGSRLFLRLLKILVQLIHLAIEHKVLAPDTGICSVVLWLMEGPTTRPKWDRNTQATSSIFNSIRPVLFATEWLKLGYLLRHNWVC